MAKPIRYARAIGGLLSVIVLLFILLASFWFSDMEAGYFIIGILVSLIASLLGVDIAIKDRTNLFQLVVDFIEFQQKEEGKENGNS